MTTDTQINELAEDFRIGLPIIQRQIDLRRAEIARLDKVFSDRITTTVRRNYDICVAEAESLERLVAIIEASRPE